MFGSYRWNSWFLFLSVLLGLIEALPVQAVTLSLLPTQDGIYKQWIPKSGSIHYTHIDESICNGTTDYVRTGTIGYRDSYSVSLSSIPDGSTLTAIRLTPCASRNSSTTGGSSSLKVFYRWENLNSTNSSSYTLSGTTPTELAPATFSGLTLVKKNQSILEIGATYASGTRGVRLSRMAVVIDYTLLLAPTNLVASNTVPKENSLQWQDNTDNEDGYRIERSIGSDQGPWAPLATLGPNTISYKDNALASSTAYFYRVAAYNAGGTSIWSNTANASTPLWVPADPSLLTVSGGVSGANLQWQDNADNENGYEIERGVGSEAYSLIHTTGPGVTTYTDVAVLAGHTYAYRVRAINASGVSGYSNSVSLTIPLPPTTPPPAPANLNAGIAGRTVALQWTDTSSTEDTFTVERRTSTAPFTIIASLPADSVQYTDTDLPNETYTYRIQAMNAAGPSAYSNEISAEISVPLIPPVQGTVIFEGNLSVPKHLVGLVAHEWPEMTATPPFSFGLIRSFNHMNATWGMVETAPNQYDWSHVDSLFNANQNKTCLYTIWGTPTFYATNGYHSAWAYNYHPAGASVPDLTALGNFVKAVVTRYQNTCSGGLVIEAWNEGDGGAAVGSNYFSGTNAQLAQITKTVYTAAKSINPSVTVLSNGTINGDWINYVDAMNAAGVKTDGFAFHFYDGISPETYAALIDDVRGQINLRGWSDVPIWDTEHGFLNGLTASLPQPHGENIQKMFIIAAMKGIKTWVVYAYDNHYEPQIFGDLENNPEIQNAIDWAHRSLTDRTIIRVERLSDGSYLVTFSDGSQVRT